MSNPQSEARVRPNPVDCLLEYAVTDGPGTLIKYGTTKAYPVLRKVQQEALRRGHTMIFSTAFPDCETGR